MPTRSETGPSYLVLGAFAGLIVALLAGNVWLGLHYATLPLPGVLSEIAQSVCFSAAGLAAWRLRPRSRTGPWMLALGLLTLVNNPWDFQVKTGMPGHTAVALAGSFTSWSQYAIAGHLVLGYPSGRLPSRIERVLVAVAFGWTAVGSTLLLLTRTLDESTCAGWCYDSPVRLVADRQLYLGIKTVNAVVWIGLTALALILLVRRAVRSTPRQRRVLGFAFVMLSLSIAFFFAFGVADTTGLDGPVATAIFRYGHSWLGVLALPVTFFVGLLQERLAFASVGSLVGRLQHVGPDAVEAALGQTLQDPTLRVAFPTAGGLVDVSGQAYQPLCDGTAAVTSLGDPPVALLIHDPALDDNPELLGAAAAAARLALDNARLHAEVRAQLAEVRASRQRIAAAADAEWQRLERDLHDGAQQRLLGAGLTLAVLRDQLTDPVVGDLIDELDQELRGAIRDLRDIAHGIRPAVLTDQGLAAALAGLARRAPVKVAVNIQITERLDPVVEATAYYLVSEALQNVARHANGASARVRAVPEPGRLVIEVTDDGPGGASVSSGTGLRGLTDRVEAVGGCLTVVSPPGGGTRVRAELPVG